MIYLIFITALVALIYGPQFWVKYVIRKHSKNLDGMPGTGSELALHLIERFELEDVRVKKTQEDRRVRGTPYLISNTGQLGVDHYYSPPCQIGTPSLSDNKI